MKINKFIYFGVLTPKAELTSHMVQFKKTDLYSYVLENGLQYRKYRLINNDYRIVIGKELAYLENDDRVSMENPHIILTPDKNDDFKLSAADEQKVREKLLSVGIYSEPRYYLFANWEI